MGELFTLLLYCLNVISILIPSNQIDLLVSYRDNNWSKHLRKWKVAIASTRILEGLNNNKKLDLAAWFLIHEASIWRRNFLMPLSTKHEAWLLQWCGGI